MRDEPEKNSLSGRDRFPARGVVTGIDSTNGTVNLHIGNIVVLTSSVQQVT